jgi:hypothetical protein
MNVYTNGSSDLDGGAGAGCYRVEVRLKEGAQ